MSAPVLWIGVWGLGTGHENRLKRLRMELEWKKNGHGLDLDLDWSLTTDRQKDIDWKLERCTFRSKNIPRLAVDGDDKHGQLKSVCVVNLLNELSLEAIAFKLFTSPQTLKAWLL